MLRLATLVMLMGCWRGSDRTADTPDPVHLVPRKDDMLLLERRERVLLRGTHEYEWVCVQNDAQIHVDGSVEIVLTSDDTTVIGGRGIGSSDDKPVTVRIVAQGSPEIFVLFDNERAKVTADLAAPRSKVHVAITGKAGLVLNGKAGTVAHYAGWGIPETFPACR